MPPSWAARSPRSGPAPPRRHPVPFIQDATTNGVKAIAISANDPDAVAPALKAAMAAGIKVVGYDSSPAVGAYDVFVNQADFSRIGATWPTGPATSRPNCTGEIAILSATATATEPERWIELMKSTLSTDPKYASLKLVDTVYGNDDATESTTAGAGPAPDVPNLKVIVAPTTVGILAAARSSSRPASRSVKVTGLGFPNDMSRSSRTAPPRSRAVERS